MKKIVIILICIVLAQNCESPKKHKELYLISNEDTFIEKSKPSLIHKNKDYIVVSNFVSNDKKFISRSLINFDFSKIPINSTIDSAFLYLDSPYEESKKSSGYNELSIERITEPWTESNVNWNNQPKSSVQSSIILPKSVSKFQDYSKINVTDLLDEMNSNSKYYGFLIKMKEEDKNYKVQWFASSNNKDEKLRPSIKIYFTEN